MAESITSQVAGAPGDAVSALRRTPWAALTIGALFLLLVLFIEAFKPGLITAPFKALLRAVGVKGV